MRKIFVRAAMMVFVLSIVASACGSDAPGSPAAAVDPGTASDGSAVVDSDAQNTTSSIVEQDESETTVPVEALAFQDVDSLAGNQVWDDVHSVAVNWTIEFPEDEPVEIVGGYTVDQGLTARWNDPFEGDVLVMFRGDQVFRAFRVGNELFLADASEEELFFAELLADVLEPLGTGVLPDSASTFVQVDGVQSELPDVFYDLAPDADEGTIIIGGDWTVDLVNQDVDVRYETTEAEAFLNREEVGGYENPILREWYLDQAG